MKMAIDKETALRMANDVVALFHNWENLGYGRVTDSDDFLVKEVLEHIQIKGEVEIDALIGTNAKKKQ